MSSFAKLLAWISFLTFDLIVLGSLVSATDSGLACPDWPLCYGKAIPVFDTQIFLEWFHRLVAGVLGVMMIVAIVKLMRDKELRRTFGAQITAAAVLLTVQIVLGGLTVLHLLNPSTVAAHLINAMAFFSVVLWMTVRARALAKGTPAPEPVKPVLKKKLYALTALTFLQIGLGGMVKTNHAGLACPDFPTCHGSWSLGDNPLMLLQMSHRYLAYLLLAGFIAFAVMAAKAKLPPLTTLAAKMIPRLLVIQVGLGVVNVLFSLPIWATVAHLANAAAMYALLLMASLELSRAPGAAAESASVAGLREARA